MKQDVTTHHGDNCCCPTCRGLRTFEQPIWQPGQVLSAADLTALQAYVKGKNRLHTRYLHGWGVVCGLEVLCDDCEGSVQIRSGYAVDPCGEDIVVSQDTRFDVIKAIRACADAKRAKTGDCDPWAPPPDPGCKDLETHWCISLKYREVEAGYVRGLVPGPAQGCGCGGGSSCGCGGAKKTSGGCGCDGSGKGGCGCGGSKAKASGSLAQWASSARMPTSSTNCSPRRLLECFEIGVTESEHRCMPEIKRPERGERPTLLPLLSLVMQLVPKGSLFSRIVECVRSKITALRQLDQRQLAILMALAANANPPSATAAEVQLVIVRFRKIIMDILADDDHPVRCQMRVTAGTIVTPGIEGHGFIEQARAAAFDLLAVFLQLIIDCICHAFIPQCDDDPCDDRVEVACVTVKGDKIIRICNHSCRRYAGAFPSTFYWMSLVPILPIAGKLLAMLCCRPELVRRNSPLVNDLVTMLDVIDPSGRIRTTLTSENFRLPRLYLEQLGKTTDPSRLISKFFMRLYSSIIHAGEAGGSVKVARRRLKEAEVKVEERDVGGLDDAAIDKLINAMLRHPTAGPGESVVLHKRGETVVAVTPAGAEGEMEGLRRELKALRDEVTALQRQR